MILMSPDIVDPRTDSIEVNAETPGTGNSCVFGYEHSSSSGVYADYIPLK